LDRDNSGRPEKSSASEPNPVYTHRFCRCPPPPGSHARCCRLSDYPTSSCTFTSLTNHDFMRLGMPLYCGYRSYEQKRKRAGGWLIHRIRQNLWNIIHGRLIRTGEGMRIGPTDGLLKREGTFMFFSVLASSPYLHVILEIRQSHTT
jgi:hypothetical protein